MRQQNDLNKPATYLRDVLLLASLKESHTARQALYVYFNMLRDFAKFYQIVDKSSATLNLSGLREKQVSMDADHSTICKFDSKDSSACRLVLKTIAAEVKRSLEQAEKS